MKKLVFLFLLFTTVYGYTQDFIFFGSQPANSIYSLNSVNGQVNTIATGQLDIKRVRVDQNSGQVFWSSGNLNNIQKADANLQGTNVTLVKSGVTNVATIAVDAFANKVYYHLNNRNQIFTCDTVGGNVSPLINLGGNKLVLGIDIDKNANQIYWTEINQGPFNLIRRADLPLGTNITTVYSTSDFIFDLKLFPKDSSIYFTNRTGNKVEKIDLNGNNLQTLITEQSTALIGAISGDYCSNSIYYILSNTGPANSKGQIKKTDLTGLNTSVVLDTNLSFLTGVDILYSFNLGIEKDFLGANRTFCPGDSVSLDASISGASYLWSNDSTQSKIFVKQPGTYSVTVSKSICSKADTITLQDATPIVFLGNDTVLNLGDSLLLNATVSGASYNWSDSSNNSNLKVKTTGIYWVDVTTFGCTTRDSIKVIFEPINTTKLSGIINEYSKVESIKKGFCSDKLVLKTVNGFSAGNQILIIQMKGVTIDSSNNPNFGDVTNMNSAGEYEFALIKTINSDTIELTEKLQNSYNVSNSLQVVSFPKYQNALITDTLTAKEWDGETGGIIAFEATDTLILQADINADGKGFRGGNSFLGTYPFISGNCSNTDYFNPNGNFNGGEKGEGIAQISNLKTFGRGHSANGGGGGNSQNSGGAGGSNSGVGGDGGNEWFGCNRAAVGGIGGEAINYMTFINRTVLGGGGGGGDANDNLGSNGGNGGGIIFIKTQKLIGLDQNISTAGLSADTATSDGAGGGGAGGSILLDVGIFDSKLTFTVNGGDGGNNNSPTSCYGTGGGGGSGIIKNSFTIPNFIISNIQGGRPGTIVNTNSLCSFSNYGATAGQSGLNLRSVPNIFNFPPPNPFAIKLGNDTTLCYGDSILLDANIPTATYIWSNNSTASTLLAKQAGIYWVDITIQSCIYRDSIIISFTPDFNFNLGNDTTLCFGASVLLDVNTPAATYTWSNNSTDSAIIAQKSGIYFVDVSINQCIKRDSIIITVNPKVSLPLQNDTTLCFGDSIVLDATTNNAVYFWSNNSANSTLQVKQAGIYWVDVTVNNCTVRDSITINYNPDFNFSLGNDTTLCFGDSILLDATTSTATYTWSSNSIDSAIIVKSNGIHFVNVNVNGCVKRDSITIGISSDFNLKLGNDTLICDTDSFSINAFIPNASYVWNDFSTDSVLVVKSSGRYFVDVTLNNCTKQDTINVTFVPTFNFNLGNDTTLCPGDSILLAPFPSGDFLWSTNSIDSSILVKTTGTYWVDITLGSCTYRDSININFKKPSNDSFLGNDTTLCDGDSMVFDLSLPGYTLLWSDSSILAQFTISSSGIYWAEIVGSNCPARDSIEVDFSPTPRFNFPNDTSMCEGELFATSNSNSNTNYLWNTGSNDSFIAINNSGTYWLETFLDGCIYRDSIYITSKPTPQINLGTDTTLCVGDSLTLMQNSFTAQYLWSDSSNGSFIQINQAGIYWLNFTVDGCETRDSILIEYFDTLGVSFLTTTTEFCEGDQLKFEIPLMNSTYLWQDGSTDNPYTILDSGLYTVQISNTCGTRTDSALVIEKCKCEAVTPNSFSPNNDFINDQFLPQISCEVTSYSLTIYSRWGEKVFESNRPAYSWNGKKRGQNMKGGIYYYILKWAETEGDIQTKKGNTLLLR